MAIICGFAFEKFSNRGMQIAGLAIGTIIAYIFGTAWLAIEAHLTFYQALLAGVIPYIPGDLVKIILVVLVGRLLKKVTICRTSPVSSIFSNTFSKYFAIHF